MRGRTLEAGRSNTPGLSSRTASANAVKTQIWTALIAMLLLKYLQLRSTFGWALSKLIALLRHQLFV